jgi:hypothetical protein
VRCSLTRMGLDKTFLTIRPCGWRGPALALTLGGVADEPMGEDSTSQTLDESPGHRSCLAAPHAAKKRGGCTHAAVALANVQAARQELTFQEPNAHSLPYPLMISGRD